MTVYSVIDEAEGVEELLAVYTTKLRAEIFLSKKQRLDSYLYQYLKVKPIKVRR